ncbi:hypothetical protein PVAP13_4KG199300 [Panicum virgatum]|uniref:Uncharacterized protein n=1 Tax=Panicum virgatum TaxID=38727 RepID=A0A8T0TNZ9_PANVG|nr:hypothetical protein PVAP13_4KG199300 [Panicum virgatum]
MARLGDLFNGEQIFGVYYEASSRRRRMRGLLLKSDKCQARAAWEKSKAQLDKQDAREYLNTGYEVHIHCPSSCRLLHLPPRRERRTYGEPRCAAWRTGLPTGPTRRRRSCSFEPCGGQPRRVTAPLSLPLGRHAVGPPAPPRHAELPAGPPRRRTEEEEEEPKSKHARQVPMPSHHDAARGFLPLNSPIPLPFGCKHAKPGRLAASAFPLLRGCYRAELGTIGDQR